LSRSSAGVLTHRPLARCAVSVPLSLPQHANQHRAKRPVLLAVDQEFGESATLGVAAELADTVGPLEVGEHQDVEQLGAGRRVNHPETREPPRKWRNPRGRKDRPRGFLFPSFLG